MIVITGSVTARAGSIEAMKNEGLAHSERSRGEEGCLSHRCYVDAAVPARLFFYEEWRDMAAVQAHFRHADTAKIMAAIREYAVTSDGPVLLEAKPAA
ncbi:putative quinol monooxygenase [Sphingomonas sp.]|uniref:putative quinol monooxygenase n=1 Tax=Sphingomonas sp. TaxID=28214 RepID=UPI003CC5BBFD